MGSSYWSVSSSGPPCSPGQRTSRVHRGEQLVQGDTAGKQQKSGKEAPTLPTAQVPSSGSPCRAAPEGDQIVPGVLVAGGGGPEPWTLSGLVGIGLYQPPQMLPQHCLFHANSQVYLQTIS